MDETFREERAVITGLKPIFEMLVSHHDIEMASGMAIHQISLLRIHAWVA